MTISATKVAWWIAMAAVIVGALLPWARVGPFDYPGHESDGFITLVLGLVGLAVPLAWDGRAWPAAALAALLLAGAICGVAVYDVADFYSKTMTGPSDSIFAGEEFAVRVGEGLWLTAGAGVAALVVAAFECGRAVAALTEGRRHGTA